MLCRHLHLQLLQHVVSMWEVSVLVVKNFKFDFCVSRESVRSVSPVMPVGTRGVAEVVR